MGVVTSKARTVAEQGIDLFGLRDRFDVIVCAEDTKTHKPEPEPLLHAARQLAVDPAACVYLGDSPYDVRAALAAGVVAVAALWGAFSAEDVLGPGPQFAISEPADLDLWLEGEHDRFRAAGGGVPGLPIVPDSIDRASGTL
jgi:pyrophosphatase PpaX